MHKCNTVPPSAWIPAFAGMTNFCAYHGNSGRALLMLYNQPKKSDSLQVKHPPSLTIFFTTEMWERYGFYVVQTLLALYLSLFFKWNDQEAYGLVGSFTALTYLSPLVGGWIADRYIGQKNAIIAATVVLCISYIGLGCLLTKYGLAFSLSGVAVGTGLLKPNISSLLGNEYPEGSPHRESGFTIFYMGITTGIIIGTTLPSYLNYYFHWSVSFFSAAIGMILALVVFVFGIRQYNIQDYRARKLTRENAISSTFALIGIWASSYLILCYPAIANTAFGVVVLITLAFMIKIMIREPKSQAKKTLIILLLCFISVMFWAFYFQMFLSLTLFISRVVQPTFLGILFPPPYYVAIQSFGMLFLGVLMTQQRNKPKGSLAQASSANHKFLFAMICMSLAYLLITVISRYSLPTVLLSPLYIIPTYLMISLAELLLSPVGLSIITVLASRDRVSTMMGIFFVSLGIGGFLSGKLASLTAIPLHEIATPALKTHYASAFTKLSWILLSATLACAILHQAIRRLIKHVEEHHENIDESGDARL